VTEVSLGTILKSGGKIPAGDRHACSNYIIFQKEVNLGQFGVLWKMELIYSAHGLQLPFHLVSVLKGTRGFVRYKRLQTLGMPRGEAKFGQGVEEGYGYPEIFGLAPHAALTGMATRSIYWEPTEKFKTWLSTYIT